MESFKHHAQAALQVGRGRLLNSSGHVLDGNVTLEQAGWRTGYCPALHIGKVRICGLFKRFAAMLGDGSVVAWARRDDAEHQGDCSAIGNCLDVGVSSKPRLMEARRGKGDGRLAKPCRQGFARRPSSFPRLAFISRGLELTPTSKQFPMGTFLR